MSRTIFQIEIVIHDRKIVVADVSPTEAVQKLLKATRGMRATDDEINDAKVEILEQDTKTWSTERW